MKTKQQLHTLLRSLIFRSVAGILATLALIGLGACASQSNQSNHPVADAFDRADTNHDGYLSKDEASDYLVNQIFDSRDANHDGRMTAEEWTGGDPSRMAEFNKRDANHDGVVTKQEAIDYARAHGVVNKIMKEADTNHDGKLSRSEVQAYNGSREGPPN
jgi:Ca2+-binding EF-hand superfamily protein